MWPDNETDRDFLNFTGVADTVAEIVVQAKAMPISIGVSGAWGVGKSSMIKLVRRSLEQRAGEEKKEDGKFIFVEFWAFAKRAVARGDDPEEVVRRIADYRGEEKHSNYARYTVDKSEAALHSKSNVGPPAERTSFSRESVDTPTECDAPR